MADETPTVHVYGCIVPVSRELLDEAADFQRALAAWQAMTPEEQGAQVAEYGRARERERLEMQRRWRLGRVGKRGALRSIATLHRPTPGGYGCEGCGSDEDWPCATFLLIEEPTT